MITKTDSTSDSTETFKKNYLRLLFLQQHLTLPLLDSFPRASAISLGVFTSI